MPQALVVSRYFPPLSSAGASIRLVKLIKYAQRAGWSFVVLTQDPARPVLVEKPESAFLLAELPTETQILRVSNPLMGVGAARRILRRIAGKSSLPWGASVVKTGLKLLRQRKPELVLVNTPPFTNVAAGLILSLIGKVPLILDFKDDWVGSTAYQKKGKLRQKLEGWAERAIVRRAERVILVTPRSYELYTQRYANLHEPEKFHLIPNGLDWEEYSKLAGRERKIETHRFTLLTAAAGYRRDYRDLQPLLRGLGLFLVRNPQARGQVELHFVGEEPHAEYMAEFERLGLHDAVVCRGVLSRQALVEAMWQADLLFLVQPYGNRTAVSGTLYEYWATGKAPVLLISEEGASSSLVQEHAIGTHFGFDETEAVVRYLEQLYAAYCAGKPIWIERAGAEQFSREALAAQMINLWPRKKA
ncbi:MAG: glycosyltransferase [Clostridiaceae bacterium]